MGPCVLTPRMGLGTHCHCWQGGLSPFMKWAMRRHGPTHRRRWSKQGDRTQMERDLRSTACSWGQTAVLGAGPEQTQAAGILQDTGGGGTQLHL